MPGPTPTDRGRPPGAPDAAAAGELTVELAVRFPGAEVQSIPLHGVHVIGRECDGVPEAQRVLIDDPSVSRHHVELRVDRNAGVVYAIDTSTNGTLLNGSRLDRAAIVPLQSGDRLKIGQVEAELFISEASVPSRRARTTERAMSHYPMVHVVGDIVEYSSLSQLNDSATLAAAVDTLFGELRALVRTQSGTLANFAGDALYAIWDVGDGDRAVPLALEFVERATNSVEAVSATLNLRTSGGPLRMGWGVTVGDASITLLAGTLTTVLGDATNVAFRLAGLAARQGRPVILVDESAIQLASGFAFGEEVQLTVKGREQQVHARPFRARPGEALPGTA